ncbi:MAG TPA: type VI secretion system baseplate subunit TssF, partial [Polyangiaceae bacterium]
MFEKYFQEEVAYLREHARELSDAYPELAPLLGAGTADADVLRLLEGTAFLTGRIRQKLDDDIPEFSQSLALLLYPHLTRPLPSASILELRPMASAMAEPHVVPAGTEFASGPVQGARCTFRSTTECVLAPIEIESVRLTTHASGRQSIEVDLRSRTDKPLAEVLPAAVRVHLTGEAPTVSALLFAILRQAESVALVLGPTGAKELSLGPDAVRWAGFDEAEALLPRGHHVLPGYRLLEEYGILPAKFAFVDFPSLGRVRELDPDARAMTVAIRLAQPLPDDVTIDATNLRLHCVPIVNVFAANAEPIPLERGRDRYVVRPAGLPVTHGEVYAILKVTAVASGAGKQVVIPPLLDLGSPAK